MSTATGGFVRWYAVVVGAALVCGLLLSGVGYFPTVRLRGDDAAGAMVVGCAVSWVASCVGAIPLARALAGQVSQPAMVVLASMLARFITVLFLVAPLILWEQWDRTVLVFWVAISYLVYLLPDTVLGVHAMKMRRNVDPE